MKRLTIKSLMICIFVSIGLCIGFTALSIGQNVTTEAGSTNETPWDVNQDRVVNVLDLVIVGQNFGTNNPVADVTGDGTVNILDLVLVAQHFGETIPEPEPPEMVEKPIILTSYEYVPDDATLGLWHFDGSNIVDSSNNGLVGEIEGSAQWSSNQDWNKGTKQGHSFSFDGKTLITFGKTDIIQPTTAITVEAWVYLAEITDWRLIFTKWADIPDGSYHLAIKNGYPQFHIFTEEGEGFAIAEERIEIGQWHHIAGTYDSEQIRVYVDGKEVISKEHSGEIVYEGKDYDVVIGSKDARKFYWIGLIDEVRISSIARQPEELSPNLTMPIEIEVPAQ